MKLVDDEAFQGTPFSVAIGPREGVRIDDSRSVMNSVRLQTRNRIGAAAAGRKFIVELRAGGKTVGECGEDAIRIPIHRQDRLARTGDTYGEARRQRRPHAKDNSLFGWTGAKLKAPNPVLPRSRIQRLSQSDGTSIEIGIRANTSSIESCDSCVVPSCARASISQPVNRST